MGHIQILRILAPFSFVDLCSLVFPQKMPGEGGNFETHLTTPTYDVVSQQKLEKSINSFELQKKFGWGWGLAPSSGHLPPRAPIKPTSESAGNPSLYLLYPH